MLYALKEIIMECSRFLEDFKGPDTFHREVIWARQQTPEYLQDQLDKYDSKPRRRFYKWIVGERFYKWSNPVHIEAMRKVLEKNQKDYTPEEGLNSLDGMYLFDNTF